MDIFTDQFTPPLELKTDQFHLFPTNDDFFVSDYEAVMKSRDFLRVWSQSTWPEDSFTREQNREDLLLHIADNLTHSAYGFMIYSLDHAKCYGSLYINPLSNVLTVYSVTSKDRDLIRASDARVDFWLREDSTEEFEFSVASAIRTWLADDWKIKTLMSAREGMAKRMRVYDRMGLEKAATLMGRDAGIGLVLYR